MFVPSALLVAAIWSSLTAPATTPTASPISGPPKIPAGWTSFDHQPLNRVTAEAIAAAAGEHLQTYKACTDAGGAPTDDCAVIATRTGRRIKVHTLRAARCATPSDTCYGGYDRLALFEGTVAATADDWIEVQGMLRWSISVLGPTGAPELRMPSSPVVLATGRYRDRLLTGGYQNAEFRVTDATGGVILEENYAAIASGSGVRDCDTAGDWTGKAVKLAFAAAALEITAGSVIGGLVVAGTGLTPLGAAIAAGGGVIAGSVGLFGVAAGEFVEASVEDACRNNQSVQAEVMVQDLGAGNGNDESGSDIDYGTCTDLVSRAESYTYRNGECCGHMAETYCTGEQDAHGDCMYETCATKVYDDCSSDFTPAECEALNP